MPHRDVYKRQPLSTHTIWDNFVLTHPLPALRQYFHKTVHGDKGYINKRLTPELKSERDIDLLFLKRENSRDNYPKEVRQLLFKVRRRIETSFSQLTE